LVFARGKKKGKAWALSEEKEKEGDEKNGVLFV